MPRVRGYRDWDAEARPFRQLLDPVVPDRHRAWRIHLKHVEMVHVPVEHQIRVHGQHEGEWVGQVGPFGQRAVLVHHDHPVKHQSGLFRHGHASQDILHAIAYGLAAVFVGVELPILVEIPEGVPVFREGGRFRPGIRQATMGIKRIIRRCPKGETTHQED